MRTAAPAPGGLVSRGYENVREAFESDLVERADDGAALAAVVDGRLVVDLWGGWADDARSVPWGRGTVAVIFSGSKGLVATLLLIAVDRGLLELDAPVARYWPEFAAHGKGGITVAELASHRAGLPGLSSAVSAKDLDDPGGLAARLAGQAPILQPGHPCYHALTYGWLCGELLRRVDGRDAGRLVQEELAAPLGDLDLAVGLSSGHPLWRRLALLRRSPGYRLS
ncbi:MAG: serine hydrolase domain-containing protein, partial [Gaiellales bacterium]